MGRALVCAGLVVPAFVLTPTPARSSLGGTQQTPVFRAGIDLINVGATITDRKGNLVTDLAVEDPPLEHVIDQVYREGIAESPPKKAILQNEPTSSASAGQNI